MMGDRLLWLAIGSAIGFFAGYIVRDLREIKEVTEEVGEIVRNNQNRHNEGGFMRFPIIADIALLIVVSITLWAAVASQKATNEVEETQAQLKQVTHCNRVYLGALLQAADERKISQQAIQSNVDLQKSWYDFVVFQLHLPPYPETQQREKANVYRESLKHFLDISKQSKEKVANNPYPTDDELTNCINSKE